MLLPQIRQGLPATGCICPFPNPARCGALTLWPKNIKSPATEVHSQDLRYQRNLAIIRSLKKRTYDGELKWRDTDYDTGNGFVITEIDTEAAGKITLELGPRNEYYGPDDIGFDLFVSVGPAASQEINAEYHKHLELFLNRPYMFK